MDRRESLKNILNASVALAVLPTWANGWSRESVGSGSFFSPEEHDVLASVADTIIPAGDAIGALSVGVDKFLVKLFANCYEPEVQSNVSKQLLGLDSIARNSHNKSFAALDAPTRQILLVRFMESSDKDQRDFYELIKSETIRGFNTSKEVMLTYHKYKLVPGRYRGCVDITT